MATETASQHGDDRLSIPSITDNEGISTIDTEKAYTELLFKAKAKAEQDGLVKKRLALEAYLTGTAPKPDFFEDELKLLSTSEETTSQLGITARNATSSVFSDPVSTHSVSAKTGPSETHEKERSRFCTAVRAELKLIYQQMQSTVVSDATHQGVSQIGCQPNNDALSPSLAASGPGQGSQDEGADDDDDDTFDL